MFCNILHKYDDWAFETENMQFRYCKNCNKKQRRMKAMNILFWRKKPPTDWRSVIRTVGVDMLNYQSVMLVGIRDRDDIDQALSHFVDQEIKKLELE